MGVIYKLKKEIVDFILSQKRENPQIGCRRLANLIQKELNFTVSKSSINSVIKQAQLSNPVGRPPVDSSKAKKFTIPDHRKKNLFTNTAYDALEKLTTTKKKRSVTPEKNASKSDQKGKIKPHQKRVTSVHKAKEVILQDSGGQQDQPHLLYESMGCIFLKAAEWAVFDKPIVHSFQREEKTDNVTQKEDIYEALLYAPMFNIATIKDFGTYEKRGLWDLNGIKDSESIPYLIEKEGFESDLNKLYLNILSRAPQLFAEIAYIKVVLKDNKSYLLDPLLSSLWQKNVHSEYAQPIHKTIERISRECIVNLDCCVIGCFPDHQWSQGNQGLFHSFVASFQEPGGIHSIECYDQSHTKLITLDTVPSKKRHYVIGLWPWQEIYRTMLGIETKSIFEKISIESFEKEIYINYVDIPIKYGMARTQGKSQHLLFIREDKKLPPNFILLTNSSRENTQTIVNKYLTRWPYCERSFMLNTRHSAEKDLVSEPQNAKGTISDEFMKPESLVDCFNPLLSRLHLYCLEHFFPKKYSSSDVSSIKSIFYDIPGRIQYAKDGLICSLAITEKGHQWEEDVETAVKIVNESHICDFLGRHLIIRL